ncbi:hypothetical protein ACFP9V_10580 [Deinococcus radiopugnans]|uniref:Lipoprotein n=1 Tax=Deinococcus radiopugnans ATCC 19172 TaxID=585398 RepID=A0A5C4XX43_9DEIO|nr:hypothetical protein [Deinococcus radiopugnans]MBB6018366.1 hypothetical protein [Deinococcus radiopugnans ATCC 19172]TNM67956.1 hypothetical protein FHR04_17420 [Deinococcus radiopugnans ATCC 19172]
MKKLLLFAPVLLAACAPAYTGPKPGPNEIIVEATSPSPMPNTLGDEQSAGVTGFVVISVLLLKNQADELGLPAGYSNFSFPNGAESMQRLSAQDRPMHVKVDWQASRPPTQNTVNVQWESRPIGGKLLSVTVKASSTDTAVNTRTVEDRLIAKFVTQNGIRLLASGR